MSYRKAIFFGLSAILAIVFVLGTAELFRLRFEAGDIYPPYSTLRTDPLGAKALWQALDELPDVSVRRNFTPLEEFEPADKQALFVLGVSHRLSLDDSHYEELADFAAGGGRLVVAMTDHRPTGRQQGDSGRIVLGELGASVNRIADSEDPSCESVVARRATSDTHLPESLAWHSRLVFEDLDPQWKTLYTCQDLPVIIERTFGNGTVVLMSDSYLLSNEAMFTDRHSGLLAYLVGDVTDVAFDEVHLGVVQQTNIMTLARRYRLAGVGAALLVLAGLFVWKSAVSFLPRDSGYSRDLSGATVAGRGATSAMMNLLRRAIRPKDILRICADEWLAAPVKRRPGRGDVSDEVRARAASEQSRPPRQRDPVSAYRDICRILSQRTHSHGTQH